MKTQKDIFLESEGDKWFLRNKEKLISGKIREDILDPLLPFLKSGMKFLEVGCSVGTSLNYIKSKVPGLEVYGMDPSKAAIIEGEKLFPSLNFKLGTVDNIDHLGKKFDFILFGFCLYLVDRESIEKLATKVNSALIPGGNLGIIDFDTRTPRQNPYSHYDGVFSYKMDYAQIFLKDPNYYLVTKKCWSHSGDSFSEDLNERCSTQVLYREKVIF